MKQHLK